MGADAIGWKKTLDDGDANARSLMSMLLVRGVAGGELSSFSKSNVSGTKK